MTIRVGILGYGFMGRTHEAAFQTLALRGADCTTRVVSLEEIVSGDDIDAVSICTPTDSHIELATAALNAGKHVLLEKPVALRASDVAQLNETAKRAQRVCMPAHCMRFWPGWPYLRNVVRDGTYGAVKAAHFRRISRPPDWNREFYQDTSKSGGALFDLHVHDVDFILWCFGEPDRVTCDGDVHDVRARFQYRDLVVHADGAWAEGEKAFEMTYTVAFDRATLNFVYDRDPSLLVSEGGVTGKVDLPLASAYEAQAAHFLELVSGSTPPLVTLEDARRVISLLECELSILATV